MTKPIRMLEWEQEIAHRQDLRATHRKNIHTLEGILANYGMEQPLKLINELEFERERLRQVEKQLEALEAAQEALRELEKQQQALEAALEMLKEAGLEREQKQLRQVKEQLEVLKSVKRPVSIYLIQVIIALVAVLVIGGAALFLVTQRDRRPPLARVSRAVSEIHIDGLLDESAWSEADSLTYAEHPAKNGSTTATVRFLWDDDYLYVSFDVSDTQVEQADPSAPWDSDSVSLLLHDGGIAEHRQSLGEELGDYRAIQLKDWTTENEPDDRDNGYTVEMQIRWIQKPPPSVIRVDLLSVDHDDDPYDLHGDKNFSKLTWDGDADITSAGGRLLLVDEEH